MTNEISYIMAIFPIVKRKELTKQGDYRTKETVLAIYDELATAMYDGS